MRTTACRVWVLAGCMSVVAAGGSIPAYSARNDDGGPPSQILKPGPGLPGHSLPQSSLGKGAPNPGPDARQLLEQRLRQGQMEQPTAQGEVSDRLDRFYRSPDSLTGGRERSGRVGQAER